MRFKCGSINKVLLEDSLTLFFAYCLADFELQRQSGVTEMESTVTSKSKIYPT